MTRPKTRTAALDAAAVKSIKQHFGTYANAYAQLFPGGALAWSHFSAAAAGRPVTPATLTTVKTAFEAWKRTHLK